MKKLDLRYVLSIVANSAELTAVYVRGMRDFSQLSDEDKLRFDFTVRAVHGRDRGGVALAIGG